MYIYFFALRNPPLYFILCTSSIIPLDKMEALEDKKPRRNSTHRKSLTNSVTISLSKIVDFFKAQPDSPTSLPSTPKSNSFIGRERAYTPPIQRKNVMFNGGSQLKKCSTADFGRRDNKYHIPIQAQQLLSPPSTPTTQHPTFQQPISIPVPIHSDHKKSKSCAYDSFEEPILRPTNILRHTFTDISDIKNTKKKSIRASNDGDVIVVEPKYGGAELRKTRSESFFNSWDIHTYSVVKPAKANLMRMASRNFLPSTPLEKGNSPENKRHKVKTPDILASDQLVFHTTRGHTSMVQAGNPLAIFEWILFREGAHEEKTIHHAFLLSFSKYVSTAELLQKLLYVFENYETPQKIRAIVMLRTWVESYYHRYFGNDETAVEILVFFISHHVAKISQVTATALTNFIAIQRVGSEKLLDLVPVKHDFEDFSPIEFAQQLTLMEHKYFRNIKPWEFLDAVILSSTTAIPSPGRTTGDCTNVQKLTNWFNKFSMWIAYEILSTMNKKKQVEILRRFISLTKKLLEMKNYNSLMAVLSALNMAPVRRLKRLWKKIPKEKKKVLSEAEKIMMPTNNFNSYRVLLATCIPPAVPLLVVHQRDLLFMYEGNPSVITRNNQKMLNFEKHVMIASCLEDLEKYQYVKYDYIENPVVQNYLYQLITVDESELRKLSLLCEPHTKEQP